MTTAIEKMTKETLCDELMRILCLSSEPTIVNPNGSHELFVERTRELCQRLADKLSFDGLKNTVDLAMLPAIKTDTSRSLYKAQVLASIDKRLSNASSLPIVYYREEPALCISALLKSMQMDSVDLHQYMEECLPWYPQNQYFTPLVVWNLILNRLPIRKTEEERLEAEQSGIEEIALIAKVLEKPIPEYNEPDLFSDALEDIFTFLSIEDSKDEMLKLSECDFNHHLKHLMLTHSHRMYELVRYLENNKYWFKKNKQNYYSHKFQLISSIRTVESVPKSILINFLDIALKYTCALTMKELEWFGDYVQLDDSNAIRTDSVNQYVENLIKSSHKSSEQQLTDWLFILIEHANVNPVQLEQELNESINMIVNE
ncbi:hypothetical protein BCU68_10885 [Vibrio sp. 10N.286.49.B3]|uniref:hypothetical protein n=1 Tax=Vibrio sp. 10N.286.49.B3 TaxID=1880855 RepID=UPI000C835B5A|nr:hypothetical protein [Vibrio sp. 10N.286.49.B3]PMH45360.1 hypothetical protein BCU68_10885 [Vibrio sp. 10N.286.49.B3]